MTTSGEDRDIKTSYELGAASYILTPVQFDNFVDVVERIDLYWILTNVPPPVVTHAGPALDPSGRPVGL